ncbi:hypothetical protein PRUPE_5G191800 [Prunus persica]|uniref:Glutathione S-transferase n=1 Tax=Prunus persica TaxID=3760 RepID=M5WQ26_PRUPE|nr:hypothetical protein PRUPE_5G191800 [Prunus persica]
MAEENKVTLYGMWATKYFNSQKLALRLKGIPYEYVQEDLRNKSPLLLKLNPVHQKVPVLVHNGKPIVESLVILEYIDETWETGPRLVCESMVSVVKTNGDAQDKTMKQVTETMKLLEEGLKEVVIFSHFGSYEAQEEALGLKYINPEKTPLISSSITALTEIPGGERGAQSS